MGLLSSLFGPPKPRPTPAEMALLAEYARLAESIGIESLVQGVDLALLPTSREHLKEIIGKATLFRTGRTVAMLGNGNTASRGDKSNGR